MPKRGRREVPEAKTEIVNAVSVRSNAVFEFACEVPVVNAAVKMQMYQLRWLTKSTGDKVMPLKVGNRECHLHRLRM